MWQDAAHEQPNRPGRLMLRVQAHASDLGGCGHYRVIWPSTAVANSGMIELDLRTPERLDLAQWEAVLVRDSNGVERALQLLTEIDADVVVLQRPMRAALADMIPMIQAQGVAVIVELDDDFRNLHRNNTAWPDAQPHLSPGRNWQHLMRACFHADLVTVSTPALASLYAPHGRVVVIPNGVPESFLTLEAGARRAERMFGWSGTLATHPTDLRVVRGAVSRLVREGVGRFGVVGDGKNVATELGLPEQPLTTGWLPLFDYPFGMQQLDLGIVPLELSPFNEAKSWLKGLEFAALGVPFIASPTSEYRRLAGMGVGEIAVKPAQWYGKIRDLLVNDDRRAEVGAQYRARVRELDLTIEGQAGRWLAAYSRAASYRASLKPKVATR